MPHKNVDVRLHRNRLLERLAIAADTSDIDFDALPDATVDTVVSLAVAKLDERATDSISVVLLCIKVLAADGQFARLKLLAPRLRSLAKRMSPERPYLELALEAFSDVLEGHERRAKTRLTERLGRDALDTSGTGSRQTESVRDLLGCSVLDRLLQQNDRTYALRSRNAALAVHAGLLLTFIDAALTWSMAAAAARPNEVLPQADPTFNEERLNRYLEDRNINVLFPSQIFAVLGGATTDADVVVSLPTSSGKTLIAEFRVAASLTRYPGSKAIYVAPYRLLARQVETSFRRGLRSLQLSIKDLGGGYDASAQQEYGDTDVLVSTPERLDSMLRLATSNAPGHRAADEVFVHCSVLVFDELQLLGRPGRGPGMELLIARLRARYPHISFLGLAASSQDVDALSHWLTKRAPISGARRPTGTLEVLWDTSGRLLQRVEPRPMQVEELPRGSQAVADAASLVARLTLRHSPVLAIEVTRSASENLANRVAQTTASSADEWRDSLQYSQLLELNQAVEEVRFVMGANHPLAQLMEGGIAFHHAGVPTHALQRIEGLAAVGALRVVCATTTVAEGADLPFKAVVIPHLNFSGGAGNNLDRDLYLNIVGRAGRANVAVEGMVFILDSNAHTLQGLVRRSLWASEQGPQVRGRLAEIDASTQTTDAIQAYLGFQSHVMGWLGDGDSYIKDQPETFASMTFSWLTGGPDAKREISQLVSECLTDLEQRGYALAASPYRLTGRGVAARLSGLSPRSVARLERTVANGSDGWLRDLTGISRIDASSSYQISRALFESVEMAERSLWLKRSASTEAGRYRHLYEFSEGAPVPTHVLEVYEAELDIFSAWIQGAELPELAEIAPRFERANALFGGDDLAKRTSDAAQYLGGLTYHAGWVWSGVKVLWDSNASFSSAPDRGTLPGFIRDAVEYGASSEAAIRFISTGGLTRPAAVRLSNRVGSSWSSCLEWLASDFSEDVESMGMTQLDFQRLVRLRDNY